MDSPAAIRICIPSSKDFLNVRDTFDEDQYYGQTSLIDVPDNMKPYFQTDQIKFDEAYFVSSTTVEFDGNQGDEFEDFPFRGVLWASPRKNVERIVKYLNSFASHHNLWGNESTFAIYRYQSCVLLVDIMNEEEVNYRLEFAEDYVRW
jgi:hypothetical protein